MRLTSKRQEVVRDGRHIICRPKPVSFADFTDARREATRRQEFRGENFERDFDGTTLFYDAVEVSDSKIVLIAPPFFNLSNDIAATAFGRGATRYPSRVRRLERHAQIWLDAPASGGAIQAACRLGTFEFPVSPNESEMFRDRRVIFTMSKNNPLEWILDWVRFNRDVHGADAVLIYDNGSTAYDSATLSAALASIAGLKCSVVMEWPFKYGPQGANSWDHWDSDFCQLGGWEHARWRFLQHARSAMNSDIDELVLSQDNQSVFEAAENSWSGLVRYRGRWIIGVEDGTQKRLADAPERHFDYSVLMPPKFEFSRGRRRDSNTCPSKWTVVPRRCPVGAQWHVHYIASWWASYFNTSRFSFRHFREIGSNWKYQRVSRVPFDPQIHKTDSRLLETFGRVDWDN